MHGSRLRFKDIVLSSRFKGLAGLVTTEPSIVTCGSKNVPGKARPPHGIPPRLVGKTMWRVFGAVGGPRSMVCRTTDEWTCPGTLLTPTPLPCGLSLVGTRLGETTPKNKSALEYRIRQDSTDRVLGILLQPGRCCQSS